MSFRFNNSIAAMLPELTEWRRDFHRNPELLYDLPRTSRIVAERLRAFGFDDVIEGVGKTGILGVLHGASGPAEIRDKRALFRADMDALPIHEASGAAYASSCRVSCTPADTTGIRLCCSAQRAISPRRGHSTAR